MVQHSDRKLQESLSALMDSEASELELHRLLKATESDSSLRESWAHYHLAADALRGEAPALKPIDLSAQICAAIADEPAHREGRGNVFGRLWHTAGRMAVAASVAGAVIIGAQQYLDTEAPMMAAAPETVGGAAGLVPDGFHAPALSTRTVNISDGPVLNTQRTGVQYQPQYQPSAAEQQIQNQVIEEHLNQLMLQHAENATHNSAQGMLPYARIAPNVKSEVSAKASRQKAPNDPQ